MPRRFYIAEDLKIIEFEAINEWGYPRHKHNFFELTFILKGDGKHILNENTIKYEKGDLFFLTPKDEHEFIINTPTTFGIIKFTEQLFLEKTSFSSSTYWRKNLETVIFHSNIIAESIIHYKEDKHQLFGLYKLMKNELTHTFVYNRNVLTELFGALLIILSRNLKSNSLIKNKTISTNKEKINNILTYIRQNILSKEKLKIKSIAETFFMSPNYVSFFIKKHAGISIQQYVTKTKIKIAEQLLKTNLSINEIAEKIGFTDASHFNKTFKKYTRKNPSEYKKGRT